MKNVFKVVIYAKGPDHNFSLCNYIFHVLAGSVEIASRKALRVAKRQGYKQRTVQAVKHICEIDT